MQIITVMIEQGEDGQMSVTWVASDGLQPAMVAGAAEAVKSAAQRLVIEAEVRGQIAAEENERAEALVEKLRDEGLIPEDDPDA